MVVYRSGKDSSESFKRLMELMVFDTQVFPTRNLQMSFSLSPASLWSSMMDMVQKNIAENQILYHYFVPE